MPWKNKRNKKRVLAISDANYLYSFGGTNKVILAHQLSFNKHNTDYFFLFPLPRSLYDSHKCLYYGLVINGKFKKVFNVKDLVRYFYQQSTCFSEIHMHQICELNIDDISFLLKSINCPIKFYIHDFSTVCSSRFLLKNDRSFCGFKPISDEKCCGCHYYLKTKTNFNVFSSFFNSFAERLTIVGPSDFAINAWKLFFLNDKFKYQVQSHLNIREEKKSCFAGKEFPIRIGFVGFPDFHKGIETWDRLVQKFGDCSQYSFYLFSAVQHKIDNQQRIFVDFHKKNNAMIEALTNHRIDIAFLWSICPETYSYTLYEAVCSDSYVITFKDSGNIAYQVAKMNNGLVFNSFEELDHFFENPKEVLKKIDLFSKTNNTKYIIQSENDIADSCVFEEVYFFDEQKYKTRDSFNRFLVFIKGKVYYFLKYVKNSFRAKTK